jgi:hypothetical protein
LVKMKRALLVLLCACGPRFQAIYEGDQRFEHCYALDDNPNAVMQAKATCWRDWLRNYTYGQTRDRVEYAAVRQRTLSRAELPTDEAMMEAAPGEARMTPGVSAPAPTSAFAPPPKTLADAPDAGPKPSGPPAPAPSVVFVGPAAASAAPPPAAECQDDCTRTWQTCKKPDDKKPDTCTPAYKACMKTCFK